MASFTVRVVLHGAESEDYEELHTYMELAGFSKEITGDSGITWLLPQAEYNFFGDFTREEVFQKAKRAAGKTNLKYAVLVTESRGRTWSGFSRAD